MPQENKDLVEKCRALLGQLWSEIEGLANQGMLVDVVGDPALRGAIQRSIASDTLTYRYVLPTQVLAKLADASLDDMDEFLRTVLALLGETGRRQLLEMVGEELDAYRSDIRHRRAWADLLSQT